MEGLCGLPHCTLLLLSLAGVWGSPDTTTPQPAGTTPCSFYTGKTCEECLKNVTCLWCTTNNTCLDYPVKSIFPPSSLCTLSNARWAACWISFKTMIILISVVAGAILLGIIICCCYCCYCRKSSSARQLEAEEENLIQERERRRQESLQRSSERTVKHNEIRKKYGLLHDSDHPYSKFD